MVKVQLPPSPNAVLKRIYPWDEYDITLVMQWLYAQAKKTGFLGTYEEFQQRYGAFVEASDQEDLYNIISQYTGAYHVVPQVGIEQILHTRNRLLNEDIVIEQIPPAYIKPTYTGRYEVTPLKDIDQVLRTADRLLEQNVIVHRIPYKTEENDAGGITVIIGGTVNAG